MSRWEASVVARCSRGVLSDRRLAVGCEVEGGGLVYEKGCSEIYDPPFAASLDLRLLSFHLSDRSADLLYSALLLFKPAMASVSLDYLHHYQPAPSRDRPVKGHPAVRNRGASAVSSKLKDFIVLASNISLSASLEDYDLIECIDLTISLPMEAIDPFRESALGFGGTENTQGNVHCPRCRWASNDGFQILSRPGPLSWPAIRRTMVASHSLRSCCAVLAKHPSALHRFRYQAQNLGTTLQTFAR